MKNRKSQSGFIRAVKKLFLSAFVVVTFAAYALQNRGSAAAVQPGTAATGENLPPQASVPPTAANNGGGQGLPAQPAPSDTPVPSSTPSQATVSHQIVTQTVPPTPVPTNTARPTQAPTATSTPAQNGQYKDGTYTGPTVNVFYGLVQVQAVIQNGRIADVQFLQYPTDRRTSQLINSYAVPYLRQEAVQAQSANVNIVTGATLTSEGFYQSLQTALNQAAQ